MEGGNGAFPVLFRVFANALADGLQVLRGQLGEELAAPSWQQMPARTAVAMVLIDLGLAGGVPPSGRRRSDEEAELGREDRPLLEVGDLEREAAGRVRTVRMVRATSSGCGMIGPDAPPARAPM